MNDLATLVHRADLDGLIRLLDGRCAAREWAGVLEIRDHCRAAVSTGRQLWPIATLAEYRLALLAPADWCARVLDDESGRFTIGPLSEVAAQTHTFAELAAHVSEPHRLGYLAHERALRGEHIPADTPNPLDIPFELQEWEPAYPLATYSDDGIDQPPPRTPTSPGSVDDLAPVDRATHVDDLEVETAVRQLFDAWTAASNGRVEVVCVEGDERNAVAALGVPRARRTPLGLDEALAWLAWAGATGGAHGRRRGGAIGRFGAWWLLAALCDTADEWPTLPVDALRALDWWWWDGGEPPSGWAVRLVVADRTEGYAWAISAHDAAMVSRVS